MVTHVEYNIFTRTIRNRPVSFAFSLTAGANLFFKKKETEVYLDYYQIYLDRRAF